MTRKTLFLGTTEVPAERSAAGISTTLIGSGATEIATEYADGTIVGRMDDESHGSELLFQMPALVEPVLVLLKKQRKGWLSTKDEQALCERAHRVGVAANSCAGSKPRWR